MYELKLKDGTIIRLKWGTYAMKLFCDKKGVDARGFFQIIEKADFDLSTLALLVQCGIEAAKGEVPTDETVFDWFDGLGGIFLQNETNPLFGFAKYVVDNSIVHITPLPGDKATATEDVKKNE